MKDHHQLLCRERIRDCKYRSPAKRLFQQLLGQKWHECPEVTAVLVENEWENVLYNLSESDKDFLSLESKKAKIGKDVFLVSAV